MSADIGDRPRRMQRPWRLQRNRARALPPPRRLRIRAALLIAAALSVSTIAAAFGVAAIRGKRAEAPAAAPPAIGAPQERAGAARIEQAASEIRPESAAAPGGVKAAPASSIASAAPTLAGAPVADPGQDYPALGVRARPLSDTERREMGAGAPRAGWKIINAARAGAPLKRGDVIVGACGSGAEQPLGVVMARLIEDSKITQCLVVLRNGEAIRVGPGETGPSP